MGRFAPPPDVGRAALGAAVPGRAAARAGALRGAAVRRPADDDAAGLRPADAADADRGVALLCDEPAARADEPPGFRAAPFAVVLLLVVLLPVALLPVVPLLAVLPAVPLLAVPRGVAPFAVEPDGFFGAALPVGAGADPLVFFAPEAPEPARGVDDGRAAEPRAAPEGRAGRREEGMGRLCRFARPL